VTKPSSRGQELRNRYLLPTTAIIGIAVVTLSALKLLRGESGLDFEVYLQAARQVTRGSNIYLTSANEAGRSFIYPPVFSVLMIPLTLVDTNVAAIIWCALNAALIVWIAKAFFELISKSRFSDQPVMTRWVMTVFPILLASRFLIQHLDVGQVNILEMALTVLALKLSLQNRSLAAGLVFGFTLVIKPVVIQFALLFLIARNVRALAGAALGVVMALLLPAAFLGFNENLHQLRYWFESFVLDTAQREATLPLAYNFSPKAVLYRLFTPIPGFTSNGHEYSLMLFQLSPGMINTIDWAIRVTLLAAISVFCFHQRRASDRFSSLSPWAMTFALTPVLFPIAQKHYFVFLLPAYVYVIYAWYILRRHDVCLVALIASSFALTSLSNRTFLGNFGAALFLATGCFIWGSFLAALGVVRATKVHR